MAAARRPPAWVRKVQSGTDAEEYVRERLFQHWSVRRIADLTKQQETPDFEFQFEGHRVGLEVKTKLHPLSAKFRDLWPEVAERDLFILNERSLRGLSWAEGLGHLLIADLPAERWIVIGPWELLLGPRRRFDDLEELGKGKLLLDLTTGHELPDVVVDEVLELVRATRAKRLESRPIRVRGQPDLPVVPRPLAPAGPPPAPRATVATTPTQVRAIPELADLRPSVPDPGAAPPAAEGPCETWCGLNAELVDALQSAHGWNAPTEV